MMTKRFFFYFTSFMVLWFTVLSCSKDEFVPLADDGLTECVACSYHYRTSARLTGGYLADGDDLVFLYKNYFSVASSNDPTSVSVYSGLFFEVPASSTVFHLGSSDMKQGKAIHLTMCPHCNTIPLVPVSGFIQGRKENDSRWLVEARVNLAVKDSGEVVDTVIFKQYFTPEP